MSISPPSVQPTNAMLKPDNAPKPWSPSHHTCIPQPMNRMYLAVNAVLLMQQSDGLPVRQERKEK